MAERQSGVALLIVLLLMAIMATAAAYMIDDEHLAIRRIDNQRNMEQAYQLNMAGEAWAKAQLRLDLEQDRAEQEYIDHPQEPWNQTAYAAELENGSIAAEITDVQGRFNINNLKFDGVTDPQQLLQHPMFIVFTRLLVLTERDPNLATRVVDFLDDDDDALPASVDTPGYRAMEPAYQPPNGFITEIGELLNIDGFEKADLDALAPFITAIPESGVRVNFNTAPDLLLFAFMNFEANEFGIEVSVFDENAVNAEKSVTDWPWESAAQVRLSAAWNSDVIEPYYGVDSHYFEVASESTYGNLGSASVSLLHRSNDTQSDNPIVSTLSRRPRLQ